MKPYSAYLEVLEDVAGELRAGLRGRHGLNCLTGEFLDCAVFKLQKDGWTEGGSGEGVFFSIWLGEKDLKKGRFNYNIHAYKLRTRPGYAVKPREFAAAFRVRLDLSPWPNVSLAYGPQTLMQGWVAADLETFGAEVRKLVKRFVAMHEVIDVLLEERRVKS